MASVYRAVSDLLNLNYLQDLKSDIAYDNGVSLQTIVGLYMNFQKRSTSSAAAQFAGMHFFL